MQSLRAKLLAAFGVVVAILAIVSAYAAWSVRSVNASATKQYVDEALPLQEAIDDFAYSVLNRQDSAVIVVGLGLEETAEAFAASDGEAEKALQEARAIAVRMGETTFVQELDRIAEHNETMRAAHQRSVEVFQREGREAALKAMLDPSGAEAYTALSEGVKKLEQRADELVAAAHAKQDETVSRTLLIVLASILLGIAAAVAVALFVTRRLLGVVEPTVAAAQALAAGDVTHKVERTSDDELGAVQGAVGDVVDYLSEMADAADRIAEGDLTVRVTPRSDQDRLGHAFTRMAERLAAMVEDIRSHAATLRRTGEDVSSGSVQTGRAVEEIAQALSGVAEGAERQVRMATDAQSASDDARRIADEGLDTANRMAAVIAELGDKSDAIVGIIATIQGLAEQTNLLALNAAIEAARAGEQGRGFAVVAEEVRKLAEESQEAAGSIANLVGEIKTATDEAVQVVSHEAGTAFGRIAEGTRTTHTALTEVASVAEETSAASQQVSASTQETSASAQHLAAAAQELLRVSTELEGVVDTFVTAR